MARPKSPKRGAGGRRGRGGQKARQELREKTREVYREAFLDAAERVFGKHGFAGARMADIARAAGVATGTIYNYFDSKDEVFRSLIELRADGFLDHIRTEVLAIADPSERLEKLVCSSFEFLSDHTTVGTIFAELGALSESSIRRIGGLGVEQRYQAWLGIVEQCLGDMIAAGQLRDDIPREAMVAFLSGAMNGIERARIVDGRGGNSAECTQQVLELFMRGAGTANE